MKNIATLLGAALLCGSLAAQAQTSPPPAGGAERKGPSAEQRHQMHERMEAAHKACEGKPDRQACMQEQMCAKAADKAKCQARMTERRQKMGQRMDQHQEIAEACTGKRGEDLRKCYRAEAEKRGLKREHGEHHHKRG